MIAMSALHCAAALPRVGLRRRVRELSSSVNKVGLVGLGAMGLPMCDNLLAAGYKLTVHDLNAESVAAAVAKGATAASTPAETANGVDACARCQLTNPSL